MLHVCNVECAKYQRAQITSTAGVLRQLRAGLGEANTSMYVALQRVGRVQRRRLPMIYAWFAVVSLYTTPQKRACNRLTRSTLKYCLLNDCSISCSAGDSSCPAKETWSPDHVTHRRNRARGARQTAQSKASVTLGGSQRPVRSSISDDLGKHKNSKGKRRDWQNTITLPNCLLITCVVILRCY
jgi:hypothetical protein